MLSAINNVKVSHGHWKRGASDLDLFEAVQELLDNAIYAEGKPNAREAHVYYKSIGVAPRQRKDILIIRDNGTGISSTFFAEEASSLGHTRDYTKKHLINKKGLGRHGGGMKNSLPPLADDVYTFICHGRGSKRERYIVRNGETLNRALVQNGKESLQWAYLPVPADFVYDPRDEERGYGAEAQLIAKTKRPLKESVLPGAVMMLTGEDSTFKSLAALLELFSEFGEGTGTMFVIAAPCSEPKQSLVPATVNDKPDLVREQDDPGNRVSLSQHIAQVYLLHPLFRGLREALWNEQNPGKAFEDLAIKFYVQQQEVDLGANSIVAAAEASGVVSPVIPILHPKGTLGWLLLAYQDKKLTSRFELANDKLSGLHMAISCRILNPQPSFFSKAYSQNQYMIKAEYFDRKNAYGHLEEMVSMDEAQLEDVPNNMRPKMPFTKADAMGWKNRAGSRNYYWTLGGAGVTGVFVANEELFTVNVDKDDLKDSRLVAFLHAKLMEHMMEWVYTNPPPDMAEALAVYERGAAVREAAAAAAAAKAAKKSAAAKALREKGAMEAAQNACKAEEDWKLPVTPQQQRSSTDRAAKARATDEITNGLALEDAPEHVALGTHLRKKATKARKRSAAVADMLLPAENGAPAPKTPGQKSKQRRASVAADDPSDAMEVDVGNLAAADSEWADFRATPVPQNAPGENVKRAAARLLARKALSVLSAPPTVVQLERLDTLFKALGKMPRTA